MTPDERPEYGSASTAGDRLVGLGLIVGGLVGLGLVYLLWRYRARPGHELPEQTHGNTTLEVTWTILPAARSDHDELSSVDLVDRGRAVA